MGYFMLSSLGTLQLDGTLALCFGMMYNWLPIVLLCSAAYQLHTHVRKKYTLREFVF